MTNTKSFTKLLARTAAVLAIGAVAVVGMAGTAQAGTGQTGTTATAGQHGDDIEGEIWWTTTDCPSGVAVPCVDPTVAPGDVYDDLNAWNKMLYTDAQTTCFMRLGVDGGDPATRVRCDREALVVFTALVTDPSYVPMVLRAEVDPEGDPVADEPENYVPAKR